MGKGDRKTAKGKRYNASYGNARPHQSVVKAGTTAVKAAQAKAPAAKKAPAKKAPAKKASA
jgi:30S ribosomal protein S31